MEAILNNFIFGLKKSQRYAKGLVISEIFSIESFS
jgi:hypothetical protein